MTLSGLFSCNETLLRQHVNDELLEDFVNIIQCVGPQPRLVQFFEKICSVHARPIKINQERCVHKIWLDKARSNQILIQLIISPGHGKAILPNRLGRMSDGHTAPWPSHDYLGKSEIEENGLPKVQVAWSGCAKWAPQQPEFLFWDAPTLGMQYEQSDDGRQLVDIEQLCWVLMPAHLCESVNPGLPHHVFQEKLENDREYRTQFDRHKQLAQYFLSQLRLFHSMCAGRSFNCIRTLSQGLSYVGLLAIGANSYLPGTVRSAAIDLVRVLYIDRYPQLQSCGRPSFPELVWVYRLGDSDNDDDGMPVLRDLSLADAGSLPRFRLADSHPFKHEADRVMSFPSATKFYLTRRVCSQCFTEGAHGGRMVMSDSQMNNLLCAMVSVARDLISFGFISNRAKIVELVVPLVSLLDGRNDVREDHYREEQTITSDGSEDGTTDTTRASRSSSITMGAWGKLRWGPHEGAVSQVKCAILEALAQICCLRENFRLSRLLWCFRCINEDPLGSELDRVQACMDQGIKYDDGVLDHRLNSDFEALFTDEDGVSLDLDNLSGGQKVNT